eukprot:10841952-Alexandrium_andersonii.AAC.1
MSASLVGSEMCIRDSHAGFRERQRRLLRAARAAEFHAAGSALAASGLAVSYTHLTLPTICSV